MFRSFGVVLLLLASSLGAASELATTIDRYGERNADPVAISRLLVESGDARAGLALNALVDGQLYRHRERGDVVIARREGSGYALSSPVDGSDLGLAGRRDVSRIAVRGAVRDQLRDMLMLLEFADLDPEVRLQAAEAALANPGQVSVAFIEKRLAQEAAPPVIEELKLLLLFSRLSSEDHERRLEAIVELAGQSHPVARSKLIEIAEDEHEPRSMRDAAAASLRQIEARLKRNEHIQTIFFGLSLGSVLVLAAIGLAITFGVMGVINMAHGELIMLGAYSAWGLQQLIPGSPGLALLLSLPAAFIISGSVGMLIERSVICRLYQRPMETLLATFGISLILQQTVRSIFGPLNQSVVAPAFMSGSLEILDGLSLTLNRLYVILLTLVVFAGLQALLRYTRFGLEVRAVAQNREMARAMGVRSQMIDTLTFGLGAGVAGIAGVALSQLTNVGPNLGQNYIVDSFLVVVVGGVGNLWGTLVAGLSLGIANKFLEPATGAVMAKILLLVIIILFIQKRPQGLFPQRGRAGGQS